MVYAFCKVGEGYPFISILLIKIRKERIRTREKTTGNTPTRRSR